MRETRHLTRALALGALLCFLLPAGARSQSDKPKPKPEPKPPKLELVTDSQATALRQKKIKIGVHSRRGEEVRVKASLVIEGIPEDFHFQLKPRNGALRHDEAVVGLRLSQRQREVLAFAEQACMSAEVDAQGKVGTRTGTLHAALRKSACP